MVAHSYAGLSGRDRSVRPLWITGVDRVHDLHQGIRRLYRRIDLCVPTLPCAWAVSRHRRAERTNRNGFAAARNSWANVANMGGNLFKIPIPRATSDVIKIIEMVNSSLKKGLPGR